MKEPATQFFEDVVVGHRHRYPRVRCITEADLENYRSFSADIDDQWALAFASLEDVMEPMGDHKLIPGNLLFSAQYGVGLGSEPLTGIVALYEVESIRYLRPVRAGDSIYVELEVLDKVPRTKGGGTVRTRRTVYGCDSRPVMEIVTKSLYRSKHGRDQHANAQ